MPRSAILAVILLGCGRTEPTSSAPPPASSSSSSSSSSAEPLAAAVTASASVAAPESAPPLAGFPAVDGACAQDADCATSFFDDQCCNQCEPRVGSKGWAKKVSDFCTAKDAGRGGSCAPRACSWVFGRPRCVDGRCASR
jgi:hypothetical protein